jgi:hypothetical protein
VDWRDGEGGGLVCVWESKTFAQILAYYYKAWQRPKGKLVKARWCKEKRSTVHGHRDTASTRSCVGVGLRIIEEGELGAETDCGPTGRIDLTHHQLCMKL